jgi:asparagine synthase (glutamine-hydrolysing)
MCGIAGIASASKINNQELVLSMLSALSSRGPDDSGVYSEDSISLGMTRLEILDPIGGKQPMQFNDRYVLVYNGQIYNHLQLRSKVPSFNWKSHSDTETLLVLLVHFGSKFLDELEGMFAFAFWDSHNKELLLARDRSGEKPLFYFTNPNDFAFASSADALRTRSKKKLNLDFQAISAMLNSGFIPPSKSVYEGFRQLKPGHYLVYKHDGFTESNFVKEQEIKTNEGNPTTFLEIFTDVVEKQSVADVEVGLFLSGGLDSTFLAHVLRNRVNHLHTFTANLGSNSPDVISARKVSAELGLTHHEIEITNNDVMGLLNLQAQYFDEPFGDSASIPLIAVSKIAKQHVGVALSGDGSDELFGGYGWRYRPFVSSNSTMNSINSYHLLKTLSFILQKFNRRTQSQELLDLANNRYFKNTTQNLILGYISKYYKNQNYITPEWSILTNFERILAENKSKPLEKILEFERLFYLNGDILVKTDRATMGCSLEARTPFTDLKVINYANSIDLNSKITWTDSKIMVRQAFAVLTGKNYVDRVKMGLGGPVDQWLSIPEVSLRLKQLQKSKFAMKLKEVYGSSNLQNALNSNKQFEWNLLNLLIWADARGIDD